MVANDMSRSDEKTAEDKRTESRIGCSEDVVFTVRGKSYKGLMRDMSMGGFFIHSNVKIPLGTELQIEFYSSMKRGNVNFIGVVAWVSERGFGVKIA